MTIIVQETTVRLLLNASHRQVDGRPATAVRRVNNLVTEPLSPDVSQPVRGESQSVRRNQFPNSTWSKEAIMKKLILVAIFGVFGLSAGQAKPPSTTLGTTAATVKGQCQGKESGCYTSCGSTTCRYKCAGDKCTVTISRSTGNPGGPKTGGGQVRQ